MLMVTVDGTEDDEEGEERENLLECKTTVLNTRGWASVEEREGKSRRQKRVRHMRIDASIFFSLSLSVAETASMLPIGFFFYLVVIDEGWSRAEQSECRRERGRWRGQEIIRRCRISSFPPVDQTRKSSAPQKLLPREQQRTVFLFLSSEYAFALLVVFFSPFLSRVNQSRILLSHRANIREREIERGKETGCLHTSSQMICYCCHFFSQSIRSILISLSSSPSSMNYRRPRTRLTRNGHQTVIVSTESERENEKDHLLSGVSAEDRPALDRSKMKWKMSEIKWQ